MKKEGFVCCICGRHTLGWGDNRQYGNNPSPIMSEGECCDECNNVVVLRAKLEQIFGNKEEKK